MCLFFLYDLIQSVNFAADDVIQKTIIDLVKNHRCHTVVLYGSRARGKGTPSSDYDVLGVRRDGEKHRIAKKVNGFYVDIFIFPERELKRLGEEHIYMRDALVLYERGDFGTKFVKRVRRLLDRPIVPMPLDERQTRRMWAYKMVERAEAHDVEGNYRRSWLQMSLLADYFFLRKRRFLGSRASFEWLAENDRATHDLFEKSLRNPTDLKLLRQLVEQVVETKFARSN